MRKKGQENSEGYKIMVVDDEKGIIEALSLMLSRSGYYVTGFTNPLEAVEQLRIEHYDLLVLDYLMTPVNGNKVIKLIREFDSDLYILLLTGYKDLAPPIETIRKLSIQGYCEKSHNYDQLLLMVESGIKSISQMHTIKNFRDKLAEIIHTVPTIYQLQPVHDILEKILSGMMMLVNSKDAFILTDGSNLVNSGCCRSMYKGAGRYNAGIGNFMEMLDPNLMEHIGYARVTRKTIKNGQGIIFPLANEYLHSTGVIYVECTDAGEDLGLLEVFLSQAAASLNNAFLHSLVNIKNDELNKTYSQLKERYINTLEVLRLAVDARDVHTRGHSDRVAYYSVEAGKEFGLPDNELETLRMGGIFHDIGKMGTNDVLLQCDKLYTDEYEEIKKHPLKGAHMLSAVSMFKDVVPLLMYHHERIDGTGYPGGLKGDEIPFPAKVLAVADAFDTMTSDNLYRNRLSVEEAVNQLVQHKGTQFDAAVVDRFITVISNCKQLKG